MTCQSCGGIIGRDCFNPRECAEIEYQQEQELQQRHESLRAEVERLTAQNARLIEVGHKHGWNGVENSKILANFFDNEIERLKSESLADGLPASWWMATAKTQAVEFDEADKARQAEIERLTRERDEVVESRDHCLARWSAKEAEVEELLPIKAERDQLRERLAAANAKLELASFALTKREPESQTFTTSTFPRGREHWERISELESELAAARKDGERLDWLESEIAREEAWSQLQIEAIVRADYGKDYNTPRPDSLFRRNQPITRAAIDAAMKGDSRG